MEKMEYTRYERARLIGARAMQIAMGAPFLIKMSKKDLEEIKYSPLTVAEKEFDKGVIPMKIIREMPLRRTSEQGMTEPEEE